MIEHYKHLLLSMFHIQHHNSSLHNQTLIIMPPDTCNLMSDCMLNIPPLSNLCNLAEVMQIEEFGSKLALDEAEQENGVDSPHEEDRNKQSHAVEKIQVKRKRKRAKATKTSEEVERQRMTHIAVERNRRKQMNQHLQILRSLMPNSYVERGDQASIVGGAIEFVRELEQLLQCLESLKTQPAPLIVHENDEEMKDEARVENVEVKLSGLFGLIKIVSERGPGQLMKTIAALDHLHLHILQTKIHTIQHNLVCSFSVKISGEERFTAEDIANSIQQTLSSVRANTRMS